MILVLIRLQELWLPQGLAVLTAADQKLEHKYGQLIEADSRNACALLEMTRLRFFGI